MRAWLIITLFAFVGTGLSIDSDCMSLDVSAPGLSQVQHHTLSLDEVTHHGDESGSKRTSESRHSGPCQHAHCSGMVLAKSELKVLTVLTQENLNPKLIHIPSVILENPLKPPAV